MNKELPQSSTHLDETSSSDYHEIAMRIKNRTPEEKRARLLEVSRGASLITLENLAAEGFFSREEINKQTWKVLNDPNLTVEQRERVQALRKKAE